MTIRESIKALVQRRGRRGRWVYVLWLASYCVLAFIATAYAAVLGQDYLSAFFFFLVPALVGYVQFRFPTVLGWVFLFIPTAFFGVMTFCLFPGNVSETFRTGNLEQVLTGTLLLIALAIVLYGFIRYRPFMNAQIAESGAAPNGCPTAPVGTQRATEKPPSAS